MKVIIGLLLYVLAIIIAVCCSQRSGGKICRTNSPAPLQPSQSVSRTDIYASFTDYEKSALYFNHRIDIALRQKFPNLITWRTSRSGISLQNQAIEVVVTLPDNQEKRLWLNATELIGDFHIRKEEIPDDKVADENVPDELRGFLEKYADIINKKIRFAVDHGINYAYFEFRNGESQEFMQKVSNQISENVDGIMCTVNVTENKLEMNVQNMLDE